MCTGFVLWLSRSSLATLALPAVMVSVVRSRYITLPVSTGNQAGTSAT